MTSRIHPGEANGLRLAAGYLSLVLAYAREMLRPAASQRLP